MAEVRMLVVSDLHAFDARFDVVRGSSPPPSSLGKPSWLDYGTRVAGQAGDPIVSLLRLIEGEAIRADLLVVPGDVCDKANGRALEQAWAELELIRAAIGASDTVATAGNHDLDSRYRGNSYDPRAALQALNPVFPLVDSRATSEYWAYGIAEIEIGCVRFVVVNSCAYHGGAESEIEHGRISPGMLQRLRIMLQRESTAEIHVVLCHHHPHPFPGESFMRQDRMIAGEDLLDLLDESGREWLIIHGHRHMARLVYATGAAVSPAVLAAGSASVRLDPPLATLTRNQIHLLTLSGSNSPSELRGLVESWNYSPGIGWSGASDDIGLPRRCGFGYRGRTSDLARQLETAVRGVGGPLPWTEVVRCCPEIQFLTPRDFQRLKNDAVALGIQLVATGDARYEAAAV